MIVKFKAFPSTSSYKGSRVIPISRIDFLHSLIFVGQSRALNPISTLIYKYKILDPFLDFDRGDIIKMSEIDSLDQTEKTFLSYNIGMAISDFCLRQIFDCKYTVHTSFGFYDAKSISKGKEYKFDLIGITKSGNKIALEAKGSLKNKQSKKKALNQVKNATINGHAPSYSIASLQGFNSSNRLYVNLIDPFELENVSYDIEIDDREAISAVYKNLIKQLKNGNVEKIGNQDFYMKEYEGVKIGILKNLEKANFFDNIDELTMDIRNENSSNYKIFSSGLYIKIT